MKVGLAPTTPRWQDLMVEDKMADKVIRIERSEFSINMNLRQVFTDGVNLAREHKDEEGLIPEEIFAKAFEESKARFLGKQTH